MATWTNETKNTSTHTALSKHMAGASWDIKGFLQQEDCFYILQEDGYKIVLNWGTTKNTSSWTNITKN